MQAQASHATSPANEFTGGLRLEHEPRVGASRMDATPVKKARMASAGIIRYLDPATIRLPLRPNRSPKSATNEEDEDLVASIEATRGNTVPIEVRLIGTPGEQASYFELVAGERRLTACRALKIKVMAFIRGGQDGHTGAVFLLENFFREALCPYDLGRQALHLLEDQERFPSRRRLADRTRIDLGLLSTAIRLAELPLEVVGVFSSPAQLQHRDAKPLTDAIQANRRAVLDEVELIRALDVPPSTKEIIKRLTNKGNQPKLKKNQIVLLVDNAKVGIVQIGRNGLPKMELDFALSEDERSQLKEVLEEFCAQIQRLSATVEVAAEENMTSPLTQKSADMQNE